jgi:hypothetical protein
VTAAERLRFSERIQRERAAKGQGPTIESEHVYGVLAAVADAHDSTTHSPGAAYARYSTKKSAKTN